MENSVLDEFRKVVELAIRQGNLWESLQAVPGLRLPENRTHFLRSVANISKGLGPLTDYRLLSAILQRVEFSPERLFGMSQPEAVAQSSVGTIDVGEIVQSAVDRALAKFSEATRGRLSTEAQSTRDRVRLFRQLHDRCGQTILAAEKESSPPDTFAEIFLGWASKVHRQLGIGKGNSVLDAHLNFIIGSGGLDGFIDSVTQYRLLVLFQIRALQLLLEPFSRDSEIALSPASFRKEVSAFLDWLGNQPRSVHEYGENDGGIQWISTIVYGLQNVLNIVRRSLSEGPTAGTDKTVVLSLESYLHPRHPSTCHYRLEPSDELRYFIRGGLPALSLWPCHMRFDRDLRQMILSRKTSDQRPQASFMHSVPQIANSQVPEREEFVGVPDGSGVFDLLKGNNTVVYDLFSNQLEPPRKRGRPKKGKEADSVEN